MRAYRDPTADRAIGNLMREERQMGKASREKGKRGEREFAALCRKNGYDARRGQQYNGLDGEDVVGLPGMHIEVKRVEALRIYDAVEQAKRDARHGNMPVVMHRRNNSEWLAIMPQWVFFEIYREWEAGQALKARTDAT